MPTPGFLLIFVGAFVSLVGVFYYHDCGGTGLIVVGVGVLVVGIGIALSGGLPALYFVGTLSAILIILGVALRLTGAC